MVLTIWPKSSQPFPLHIKLHSQNARRAMVYTVKSAAGCQKQPAQVILEYTDYDNNSAPVLDSVERTLVSPWNNHVFVETITRSRREIIWKPKEAGA